MINAVAKAIQEARERLGLSKAELARRLGISGSAISQWEAGITFPDISRLADLARTLQTDFDAPEVRDYLLERGYFLAAGISQSEPPREQVGLPFEAPSSNGVVRASEAPDFASIQGFARDIPVLGGAIAGDETKGDVTPNGTEIDRAIRPPGLANTKDVFAVYVQNDSMYPAWRENALVYVNPNRPPSIGDDVIVELKAAEPGAPGLAYLKRLKARVGSKLIVEQFNPPKDLEFEKSAVRLYRVVPWEEALGLS